MNLKQLKLLLSLMKGNEILSLRQIGKCFILRVHNNMTLKHLELFIDEEAHMQHTPLN